VRFHCRGRAVPHEYCKCWKIGGVFGIGIDQIVNFRIVGRSMSTGGASAARRRLCGAGGHIFSLRHRNDFLALYHFLLLHSLQCNSYLSVYFIICFHLVYRLIGENLYGIAEEVYYNLSELLNASYSLRTCSEMQKCHHISYILGATKLSNYQTQVQIRFIDRSEESFELLCILNC
jgi:hypothetical protein